MTNSHYEREIKQLTTRAAELRERTLLSRLAMTATFCHLAEIEIKSGAYGEAAVLFGKVKESLRHVSLSIEGEHELEPSELKPVRDGLARIQSEFCALELLLAEKINSSDSSRRRD